MAGNEDMSLSERKWKAIQKLFTKRIPKLYEITYNIIFESIESWVHEFYYNMNNQNLITNVSMKFIFL